MGHHFAAARRSDDVETFCSRRRRLRIARFAGTPAYQGRSDRWNGDRDRGYPGGWVGWFLGSSSASRPTRSRATLWMRRQSRCHGDGDARKPTRLTERLCCEPCWLGSGGNRASVQWLHRRLRNKKTYAASNLCNGKVQSVQCPGLIAKVLIRTAPQTFLQDDGITGGFAASNGAGSVIKSQCRRQRGEEIERRNFVHLLASAIATPALPQLANAQAYPARPVQIVCGFPPGGVTDLHARLIGQWLTERLGQQFIVENRTGAGGSIGTEYSSARGSRWLHFAFDNFKQYLECLFIR